MIVSEDTTKRGKWPLGRVTRIIPSEDGVVRVAEVRTKDGVYTRPVVKLYPLEDDMDEEQEDNESGEDGGTLTGGSNEPGMIANTLPND